MSTARRHFLQKTSMLVLGQSVTTHAAEAIEVVHTRAFAATPDGGNPCPVVPAGDALAAAQMQAISRKFGQDAAILLKPTTPHADLRIRYFVPDHEMGVSGHATIAAITVALARQRFRSPRIKLETINGVFEIGVRQQEITLEQKPPVFGAEASADATARALNLSPDDLLPGIQVVSASRPKLLVPLKDAQTLNRIQPDFEAMWTMCDELKVSGFYPFTRNTDKQGVAAEARQFPLRAGFPEDAATGVAAAALGAYLAKYDLASKTGSHEFRIAQGYAMGAPSLIVAIADCTAGQITRTAVRGTARILRTEQVLL